MLVSALAGFGLGLSLIVAIGAQNLFVLRQGLRRERVLLVASICAASDAVLIVLGVSGVGLVLQALPWLIDAVRWAGALFLVAYGVLAARRAWRPSGVALDATAPSAGGESAASAAGTIATRANVLPVVLTCLALTWLNPHVYLDTVFLLGTVAATHGDARWEFAAGACTASLVWFFGLALGARFLSRWLSTPRAWRVLDGVIAVVMVALGVSLVLPH
ncbi:MAG: LysE/ArgO family amino acid transporter [Microbacterium sp.]|uniref:LysE/ArgO family amino acid transporter n=1 Tax=Microbacterium sp. TaxID=51671 RepID=UPI0039E65144